MDKRPDYAAVAWQPLQLIEKVAVYVAGKHKTDKDVSTGIPFRVGEATRACVEEGHEAEMMRLLRTRRLWDG